MSQTIQFYPMDFSYKIIDSKPVVFLYGVTLKGEQIVVLDYNFKPYFYVIPKKGEPVEDKIKKILPTLELLEKQKEEEREAIVFKGPKGIKTAFNDLIDTLKRGEHVNIMGVYQVGDEFKRLALYFQKIRSKKVN